MSTRRRKSGGQWLAALLSLVLAGCGSTAPTPTVVQTAAPIPQVAPPTAAVPVISPTSSDGAVPTPGVAPTSAPPTAPALPSVSTEPAPTGGAPIILPSLPPDLPPPDQNASSQALIAEDLAAGRIDLGASLIYRAWALFWDPRLPERYDGAGSIGEDQALFLDIDAAAPTLPADQQSELRAWTLRPTDPGSPFGPDQGVASLAPMAATPSPASQRCRAPRQWIPQDWSADGSADVGFRAWICVETEADAQRILAPVLAIGARLWPAMTTPQPGGMGRPVPDTPSGSRSDGNGKIDIYVVEPNQCRIRPGQDDCRPIETGTELAFTKAVLPCANPGIPAGCSSFMVLGRKRLGARDFEGDIAHEFFHVLQHGYTAGFKNWYVEASASWAEYHYLDLAAVKEVAKRRFDRYQAVTTSLLRYTETSDPYRAWVWPLFQEVEADASAIFRTWKIAGDAVTNADIDRAVDATLHFDSHFRDFAVRNLQPKAYRVPSSVGLERDRWQDKVGLTDFPETCHALWGQQPCSSKPTAVSVGGAERAVTMFDMIVPPLAAGYHEFSITDPAVREIEIDLTAFSNVGSADLDLVGRLEGTNDAGKTEWRRIPADGPRISICRDDARENFDLLYVVISNHAMDRTNLDADYTKSVQGQLKVTARRKCKVPDGFEVTFSGSNSGPNRPAGSTWSGKATFRFLPAGPGSCTEFAPRDRFVAYCYGFVSGQISWTWSGQTIAQAMTTATDGGSIQLVTVSEDPDQNNRYLIELSPRGSTYVIETEDYTNDAVDGVRLWVYGARYYPIVEGYAMRDSLQRASGSTSQSWSWSMTPIFDPDS